MFDLNFHYELNQRIITLITPFETKYPSSTECKRIMKNEVSLQQSLKYSDLMAKVEIYDKVEYGYYIMDVLKYFDLYDIMNKIYTSRTHDNTKTYFLS